MPNFVLNVFRIVATFKALHGRLSRCCLPTKQLSVARTHARGLSVSTLRWKTAEVKRSLCSVVGFFRGAALAGLVPCHLPDVEAIPIRSISASSNRALIP